MSRAAFWEPLAPGWFLQWAVEMYSRGNPNSAIHVSADGETVCGYVPHDWNGSSIDLVAKAGYWSGNRR